MKNFLFLCLVLIASISTSQNHLEDLSFEDTRNPEIFRSVKNGTTLSAYVAADGAVLKIKDTLIIGSPVGSVFTGIIKGRPSDIGNILNFGKGKNRPGQELTGEKAVILAMKVEHEGSKKTPLSVIVLLGEANETKTWKQKFLSVTNYEKALRAGEVVSSRISLADSH